MFTFVFTSSLDPKPPGNVELCRGSLWSREVPRDGPRSCRKKPRDRASAHFVHVSIDDGVSTHHPQSRSFLLLLWGEVVRCRAPDAGEEEEAEDVRAVAQRPRCESGFERLVDRGHVGRRRGLSCIISILHYSRLERRMKARRREYIERALKRWFSNSIQRHYWMQTSCRRPKDARKGKGKRKKRNDDDESSRERTSGSSSSLLSTNENGRRRSPPKRVSISKESDV